MPSFISRSAVAKMYDPELPMVLKEVVLPTTYSAGSGFTVVIDELENVAMAKPLGVVVNNNNKLIAVMQVSIKGNEVTLYFGEAQANSSTGDITIEPLPDGSSDLAGQTITILAVGNITNEILPPPAPPPQWE